MANRKKNTDEFVDMMESKEFDEIEKKLNYYFVQYPDEHKIDATIDTLRQYVPDKKKQSTKLVERFWALLKHSGREFSLISKSYWLSSIILFIFGYLITNYGAYNPLFTLVILAPIPFIFGLIEVFKGREQGLLEMEMACKFSAHEIMLSRMLLVGVFNITLNTMLTIGFLPLVETISILEILLVWFTPFTIFAAFALWLSMKFRGAVFVMTFLSLWVSFSALVVSYPAWGNFILNMHIAFHFLFMGIGIIMFVIQMKQLVKKYYYYEEVGNIEVTH